MRKSWQERVHDTGSVIANGVLNFIRSDNNRRHEDPTSPSHPHAPKSQLRTTRLPRDSGPIFLTKNVSRFVQDQDNAESDPIQIPSDDEDDPLHHHESSLRRVRQPQLSQSQVASALPQGRNKRSESRDEATLLGGFTKDNNGTVIIPDPMTIHKKSFLKPGLKPMNTLNEPRLTSKERWAMQKNNRSRPQLNEQTSSVRVEVRANDHTHPIKRRMIRDPRKEGHSTMAAIALDDSQITDDSPDELQLSPEVKSGQSSGILRRRDESQHGADGSLKTSTGQAHDNQLSVSEFERASPEDEGQFTKTSAQQRRAVKDKMLRSSSPQPPEQRNQDVAVSPYFSKPAASAAARRNGQIHNRTRVLQQKSPDALQMDAVPSGGTSPTNAPAKSSSSMSAKELISPLIVGSERSAVVARPGRPRAVQSTNIKTWNLQEVVCAAALADHPIYIVQVDKKRKRIMINTDIEDLGSDPLFEQPLEKLIEIRPADDCDIVSLDFSRSSNHAEAKIYLRFESEKPAWEFVRLLQSLFMPPRYTAKTATWMEDALKKAKESPPRNVRRGEVPLPSEISKEPPKVTSMPQYTKANTGEKRIRLVDQLQGAGSTQPPRTVISGADRSGLGQSEDQHSGSVDQGSSQDISLKRKQTQASHPTRRVTRSRDHSESVTNEDILTESRPKPKLSEREVLGDPWKNDLAYPISDKKFAVVPFEDLRRLNDDEYLNDNLISFFVQYLEAYLEKTKVDAWRRIYFFNSYFFDTLTRTPKGKKGINYQGVSKWTKNLNLFKRDFVVVPVNENFHWYVAIICNLQYFLPEAEKEAAGQADEDDTPAEQVDEQSNSHTEETQKSLAELSISDSEAGQQNKAQSRKGRGRRKSGPLRKYDTDKPVIITLDSLGTPRSATCSILKQYIAAEAKNKLGLDIDTGDIQGMTAKQIPTQSNFSDCGLYLCMYLEQFVTDPDKFVYRILQRVENAQQWPQKIHSHELRSRLRDLLLELHRRQEHEESKMHVPEVGDIMIQKKQPAEPVVPNKQPTREEIGAARSRYQTVVDRSNTPGSMDVKHSEDEAKETGRLAEKSLVTVENHEDKQSHMNMPDRSVMPSETRPKRRPGNDRAVEKDVSTHSTPAECAAQLREQTDERESRKKQRIGYNDESRRARSDSASTDFLTGTESYIASGTPPSAPSDERTARRGESPGPEFIAARKVSPFEAVHGRKRKRHLAEPNDEVEQATAVSDARTEIPETQESTSMLELAEMPIKKKEILAFEMLEDQDASLPGGGTNGAVNAEEEDEMLLR
ncbi:hypothetical protein LTR44_003754 [Exophiala sp. CCFEE 6388]|nr:hypothetical protein LTR44_003754 [Eurotiomycetes sp. CCFEE 6388]